MNGLRLSTLGGLSLVAVGDDGESLLTQRRKLALLAVLALATRPLPRDVLVEMFWGDEDEERARHSLSNALSSLRRVLGPGSIATRRSEISLGEDLRLAVDAAEFEAACECGDHARAVSLYRGPFLDGVYVERSPSFDEWTARRRARLERMFEQAQARLEAQPPVEQRPVAAPPALVGAPTAAPQPVASGDAAAADATLAPPAPPTGHARARRPWLIAAAVVGVAAALLVGELLVRSPLTVNAAPAVRPVIAIAGIASTSSDTASSWLGAGMQQMISAGLARSANVEVVEPSRVRDVLARSRLSDHPVLSSDQARDIARRLGATWVVVGGVTRSAEGPIVLDVTLRDVNSGKRLLLFTVSGTNPIAVADEATARLVSGADANAPGPHLADVETANLAAYQHYVRASQAYGEGRTPDCERELDAAIAADSGFVSAIVMRLQLARNEGDVPMESRLGEAYNRAAGRATNWDQLDQSLFAALHNGENERAEALAREMVTRYPHDPTAYSRLADVLQAHGHFAAADSVFQRALSLDSLATLAGSGPCAPCAGYGGLAQLRADFGDLRGAEQAARRWVELQPDIPLARSELALVLAYEGRFDAAVAAARRALWLGGDASAPFYQKRLASLLIMARRYDAADSIIQSDLDDPRADVRGDGADLLELLQRERGQYRASARTIEALVQRDSSWVVLEMVRANSLGRAGDVAGAEAAMRRAIAFHPAEPAEPVRSLVGDRARKYAWEHAMRADVLRAALDTVQLAAIADSVQAASARSYYGRDWGLSHHLRGLIAQRAGRYDQAVRDFQAARWGHGGWSRTNVELARSYLALRRPDSAVAVLRDAYRAPLDAMGRYVPRSELDFWMATAMARAGMADSAAVYGAYVRRAWDHADPDVRARLAALPH